MSKITYEQKMELLDRYITRPMAVNDPDILRAVKVDVIKGASKGVRTAAVEVPEQPQNALYNSCMGVYRAFLKAKDSHLDMSGRNARLYNEAMNGIIDYLRSFMRSNQKPHADDDVLKAIQFIFTVDNWNRLNNYHRNRIQLPDIRKGLPEILPMIKNGYDQRTATQNHLNNLESRLKAKRQ